jgi:uncharacterized protein
MTPARYLLAMVLFHAAACLIGWRLVARWTSARCRLDGLRWARAIAADFGAASVLTYAAALLATIVANASYLQRIWLGQISGRLMGQALFGEAILVAAVFGDRHRRAGRPLPALLGGLSAAVLVAVYVDAYRVEPTLLRVRTHVVDDAPGELDARTVRILQLTDIQTPSIGPHEELALRAGLSYRPDLIVLTGDYVQDALGRPTEQAAARDLRAMIDRVGFDAPLGIFATEGDVGPPCREVFAGTRVHCLTDASETVTFPDGGTLGITGLSRGRGRERNPVWLARLLSRGPGADHRIVISHAPDFVDAMPVDVDLVLAGHTHGGQVVIPFFGPLETAIRLPRVYAGGLHDFNGIPLHVSRGVGMERGFAPPVRFFCPPEICVLDLRLSRRSRTPEASTTARERTR